MKASRGAGVPETLTDVGSMRKRSEVMSRIQCELQNVALEEFSEGLDNLVHLVEEFGLSFRRERRDRSGDPEGRLPKRSSRRRRPAVRPAAGAAVVSLLLIPQHRRGVTEVRRRLRSPLSYRRGAGKAPPETPPISTRAVRNEGHIQAGGWGGGGVRFWHLIHQAPARARSTRCNPAARTVAAFAVIATEDLLLDRLGSSVTGTAGHALMHQVCARIGSRISGTSR